MPCECGCGQETTVHKGKARRFVRGHNSPRKRVERTCEECGQPFETWPSIIKQGKAKFCSTACQYSAQTGKPRKEDVSRSAWHYRTRALFPLDGRPCERCGERPAEHCHHRDERWWNIEPENIERLCAKCHIGIVHKTPAKAR